MALSPPRELVLKVLYPEGERARDVWANVIADLEGFVSRDDIVGQYGFGVFRRRPGTGLVLVFPGEGQFVNLAAFLYWYRRQVIARFASDGLHIADFPLQFLVGEIDPRARAEIARRTDKTELPELIDDERGWAEYLHDYAVVLRGDLFGRFPEAFRQTFWVDSVAARPAVGAEFYRLVLIPRLSFAGLARPTPWLGVRDRAPDGGITLFDGSPFNVEDELRRRRPGELPDLPVAMPVPEATPIEARTARRRRWVAIALLTVVCALGIWRIVHRGDEPAAAGGPPPRSEDAEIDALLAPAVVPTPPPVELNRRVPAVVPEFGPIVGPIEAAATRAGLRDGTFSPRLTSALLAVHPDNGPVAEALQLVTTAAARLNERRWIVARNEPTIEEFERRTAAELADSAGGKLLEGLRWMGRACDLSGATLLLACVASTNGAARAGLTADALLRLRAAAQGRPTVDTAPTVHGDHARLVSCRQARPDHAETAAFLRWLTVDLDLLNAALTADDDLRLHGEIRREAAAQIESLDDIGAGSAAEMQSVPWGVRYALGLRILRAADIRGDVPSLTDAWMKILERVCGASATAPGCRLVRRGG